MRAGSAAAPAVPHVGVPPRERVRAVLSLRDTPPPLPLKGGGSVGCLQLDSWPRRAPSSHLCSTLLPLSTPASSHPPSLPSRFPLLLWLLQGQLVPLSSPVTTRSFVLCSGLSSGYPRLSQPGVVEGVEGWEEKGVRGSCAGKAGADMEFGLCTGTSHSTWIRDVAEARRPCVFSA